MQAVKRSVRLLVAVALINYASCHDSFSEQDLLRLQQLSHDGQVETITSYTNIVRDPASLRSLDLQYQMAEDASKHEFHRINQGRSDRRKVIRIKNPFQRQLEPNDRQEEEPPQQDNNAGASNYASMQFSLPPEDFIQKMRAENHYLQSLTTPAPGLGYTATPQPQYNPQNPTGYDATPTNQVNQMEQKLTNLYSPGSYPYGAYQQYDSVQSTPSPLPPFLSTQTSQFDGTPSNYVSSISPVFLSSQANIPQYVSSPAVQTGTPDYPNRVSTANSREVFTYEPNEPVGNKQIQIDHYDNAANGMRYPVHQYSNEYPSSTAAPSSTPYPEQQDNWQNSGNQSPNTISKSLQELSLSQYQNTLYNNPHDVRQESSHPTGSGENHRVGNIPSANNLYMDYSQPDYQSYNSKQRQRDLAQEASQSVAYSNGEYGWKMNDKKYYGGNDGYASASSPNRYQSHGLHSDGTAVSQMNFYMDSGRQQPYDQISKSSSESQEAQEFAKAAAKAHENMKQQQQLAKLTESYFGQNSYAPSFNPNSQIGNNQPSTANIVTTYYGNGGQRTKSFVDSPSGNNLYNTHTQQDIITASPQYYYSNSKESSYESKSKLPFDHAKALKNIVPIDVSNVLGNDSPTKPSGNGESSRYVFPNYSRDQLESFRQYYKPLTESYYRDKNSGYGLNIKTKPEDLTAPEGPKDQSTYYIKPVHEQTYSPSMASETKRYNFGDGSSQAISYMTQSSNQYQASQQPSSTAQSAVQRSPSPAQTELSSILKLNDIPYRLTQNIPPESLRYHNFDQSGIPSQIPSRINQNVGTHQIDVNNNILSKFMQKQQNAISPIRPDIDLHSNGMVSNINGFRVANPFNVDLKLVANMLKGKPTVDDTHMISSREPYGKPYPLSLDMSSLQQLLLKNDNFNSLQGLSDGVGVVGSPYLEIYNSGRYPYQGPKYSRSQEEEEHIPIADASNTHAIGAVMEQDDLPRAREVTEESEFALPEEPFEETESKTPEDHKTKESKHRHPNALTPSSFPRKYLKSEMGAPYPLLTPPRAPHSRSRLPHRYERRGRRHRLPRPKFSRMLKTEALFEAGSEPQLEEQSSVPVLLKAPAATNHKSETHEKQRS